MARVTVEDCLDRVSNRFELIMLASKRARDIARGTYDPLVDWENDKTTVVALREIATGVIDVNYLQQQQQKEEQQEQSTFEPEQINTPEETNPPNEETT